MSELSASDQELIRREEVRTLRSLGINPFPSEAFDVTTTTQNILANFDESKPEFNPEDFTQVALAGRIMIKRIQGKISFAELQDATGRIQIFLGRDELCPDEEDKFLYNELFKKLTSLGDFVGITGYVYRTEAGEVTIRVQSYRILSKTLRPLPVRREKDGVVYDAFADVEQRYRMRYVDLVVNPEVKQTFEKRIKLFQSFRDFLNERGYLEVETPILQPIYGGAYARPFVTHHNTLDMTLYLRVANELYLKRLIVGGFDGVYEFSKDFRNEGMSRFHNPEFTQIELYVAYKDYIWMMNLVEEMVERACMEVNGTTEITFDGKTISFARPWKRITLYGAIEEFTGKDVSKMSAGELYDLVKELGIKYDGAVEKARLIDEIFGAKVEPFLIQPTFIMDYPVEMSPLAKKHRTAEGLVERFEAVCNGKEICNAYSELNDPEDQQSRFLEQAKVRAMGDDEAMQYDEDFIRALEYGMPPTAGLGIGMDRLSMILTGSTSIQDVLFFPHMRPEKSSVTLTDAELIEVGIDTIWKSFLVQMGIESLAQLGNAIPPKLFKKMTEWKTRLSYDLPELTDGEVRNWINKAKELTKEKK